MDSIIHLPGLFFNWNDLITIFLIDSVIAWHSDEKGKVLYSCWIFTSSADIHNLRHPTLKMWKLNQWSLLHISVQGFIQETQVIVTTLISGTFSSFEPHVFTVDDVIWTIFPAPIAPYGIWVWLEQSTEHMSVQHTSTLFFLFLFLLAVDF